MEAKDLASEEPGGKKARTTEAPQQAATQEVSAKEEISAGDADPEPEVDDDGDVIMAGIAAGTAGLTAAALVCMRVTASRGGSTTAEADEWDLIADPDDATEDAEEEAEEDKESDAEESARKVTTARDTPITTKREKEEKEEEEKDVCKHLVLTKKGSNQYVERTTCKQCGKLLFKKCKHLLTTTIGSNQYVERVSCKRCGELLSSRRL